MTTIRIAMLAAGALLALSAGAAAQAQATRTWVSGVGDDTNPCSRTAPCKTFAGAIAKTAPGGTIICREFGTYGPITITKSIEIDCAGSRKEWSGAGLATGGIGVGPFVGTMRELAALYFDEGARGFEVTSRNAGLSANGGLGTNISYVSHPSVEVSDDVRIECANRGGEITCLTRRIEVTRGGWRGPEAKFEVVRYEASSLPAPKDGRGCAAKRAAAANQAALAVRLDDKFAPKLGIYPNRRETMDIASLTTAASVDSEGVEPTTWGGAVLTLPTPGLTLEQQFLRRQERAKGYIPAAPLNK